MNGLISDYSQPVKAVSDLELSVFEFGWTSYHRSQNRAFSNNGLYSLYVLTLTRNILILLTLTWNMPILLHSRGICFLYLKQIPS